MRVVHTHTYVCLAAKCCNQAVVACAKARFRDQKPFSASPWQKSAHSFEGLGLALLPCSEHSVAGAFHLSVPASISSGCRVCHPTFLGFGVGQTVFGFWVCHPATTGFRACRPTSCLGFRARHPTSPLGFWVCHVQDVGLSDLPPRWVTQHLCSIS